MQKRNFKTKAQKAGRGRDMRAFAAAGREFLRKHPDIIRKRNAAIRAAYKSRKLHNKISKAMKEVWKRPEYRKLIDFKVTEWWRNHPNVRKQRSTEIKKFFLTHPQDFESKFLHGKFNKFKLRYKTPQGFKVRSEDELQIARFLQKHRILTTYESEALNLDGQICVPDFYLPDYKIFIEYYGGYPGSWKKKHIKNKLYRKYDVPVIAVTPAELRNLDAGILRELRREFGKGAV